MGNLDDPRMPYDYSKREYGTVPPDTERKPFKWVSEIAYKNVHRIVARGYDTTELVEEGYGLVDMLFIDFQSRIPLVEEERMLNYLMILALEDGLSMPATLSRIVAQSKTFLTQACGASILAFGHAYGAFAAFCSMLEECIARAEDEGRSMQELAEELVRENRDSEALGVSSLMLVDPAARRVFARAEKLGVAGKHIAFTQEIVKAAQRSSKEPVDLDMLGATGATMMDLGFTPEATWAIIAVTRAFAAGAHYIEELERGGYRQWGQTLTPKEDYDGPLDRPIPPLEQREGIAAPAQIHTLADWAKAMSERKKVLGSGFGIAEDIDSPGKEARTKRVGHR